MCESIVFIQLTSDILLQLTTQCVGAPQFICRNKRSLLHNCCRLETSPIQPNNGSHDDDDDDIHLHATNGPKKWPSCDAYSCRHLCICAWTQSPRSFFISCVRFVFHFIWHVLNVWAGRLFDLKLYLSHMQIPIIAFDSCNLPWNPISFKLAFTGLRFSNLTNNSKITHIQKEIYRQFNSYYMLVARWKTYV